MLIESRDASTATAAWASAFKFPSAVAVTRTLKRPACVGVRTRGIGRLSPGASVPSGNSTGLARVWCSSALSKLALKRTPVAGPLPILVAVICKVTGVPTATLGGSGMARLSCACCGAVTFVVTHFSSR